MKNYNNKIKIIQKIYRKIQIQKILKFNKIKYKQNNLIKRKFNIKNKIQNWINKL